MAGSGSRSKALIFGLVPLILLLAALGFWFAREGEGRDRLRSSEGPGAAEEISEAQVRRNVERVQGPDLPAIDSAPEGPGFAAAIRVLTMDWLAVEGVAVEVDREGETIEIATDTRGLARFRLDGEHRLAVHLPNQDQRFELEFSAEVPERRVFLEERRALLVRALDDQGRPLEGAEIWRGRTMMSREPARLVGKTDPAGELLVRGLRRGEQLQARHERGLVSRAFPVPEALDETLTLEGLPPQRRIEVEVVGRPVDAAGKPRPITLYFEPDRHIASADGSRSGLRMPLWEVGDRYRGIAARGPETWRVDLQLDGRSIATEIVEPQAPSEFQLRFDLSSLRRLRVRVVDEDGGPLAGARLFIEPQRLGAAGPTDENGEIVIFIPVDAKGTRIIARHEISRGEHTIEEGELEGPVEIVVEPIPIYIQGLVRTSAGQPLPRQSVIFHPPGDEDPRSRQRLVARTDLDGVFRVAREPEPGPLEWRLFGPEGIEAARGIIEEGDREKTLEIRAPDPLLEMARLEVADFERPDGVEAVLLHGRREEPFDHPVERLPETGSATLDTPRVPGTLLFHLGARGPRGAFSCSDWIKAELRAGETTTLRFSTLRPAASLRLAPGLEFEIRREGLLVERQAEPREHISLFFLPAGPYELFLGRKEGASPERRLVTLESGERLDID